MWNCNMLFLSEPAGVENQSDSSSLIGRKIFCKGDMYFYNDNFFKVRKIILTVFVKRKNIYINSQVTQWPSMFYLWFTNAFHGLLARWRQMGSEWVDIVSHINRSQWKLSNIYSLPYFLLHTLKREIYGCNINSMCTHTWELLVNGEEMFPPPTLGKRDFDPLSGTCHLLEGWVSYFPREAWWCSEILSFVPISLSLERMLQAFSFLSVRRLLAPCRPPVSFRPCPPTSSSFMYILDAALCLRSCVWWNPIAEKKGGGGCKQDFYVLGINLQQLTDFPEHNNIQSTVELCTHWWPIVIHTDSLAAYWTD